jgi:hypothetical protein
MEEESEHHFWKKALEGGTGIGGIQGSFPLDTYVKST